MSLATLDDLQKRMDRPLTEAEKSLAGVLLSDAETKLRALIPGFDQRVEASGTYRELAVIVICAAVIRVLNNPGIYLSETDGDYSYRLDTNAASAHLSFLADELKILGLGGAFAIDTAATHGGDFPYSRPDLWFQYGWTAQEPIYGPPWPPNDTIRGVG